jgi:hypothetical protein
MFNENRTTAMSCTLVLLGSALLSGCGAGATKPEDITAFYTRYDYLIGQSYDEASRSFTRDAATLEAEPGQTTNGRDYSAVYDMDASIDYVGFELDSQRETELRANQAATAGGFGGPGVDIMANPAELERVIKTDGCGLRMFVGDDGRITDLVFYGDVYTVRFIDPVPSSCTKRLDALLGFAAD